MTTEPEWDLLDSAVGAYGQEISLLRRGLEYSVEVDDSVLMNSESHHSEDELARLGCARCRGREDQRVLVGGLGMGFTLRAALDTLSLHHRDERVLIVGHQVVVLCLRYLLEGLSEAEILAIDAEGDVANCGVTTYERRADGGLELEGYNFVAPLEQEGAPVTTAPDAKVAAR